MSSSEEESYEYLKGMLTPADLETVKSFIFLFNSSETTTEQRKTVRVTFELFLENIENRYLPNATNYRAVLSYDLPAEDIATILKNNGPGHESSDTTTGTSGPKHSTPHLRAKKEFGQNGKG